jgi:hypothetical protein
LELTEKALDSAELPIGSIVPSFLPPKKFAVDHGSNWVLADGKSISPTSKYSELTGSTELPDLSDVFLRGTKDVDADHDRVPAVVKNVKWGDRGTYVAPHKGADWVFHNIHLLMPSDKDYKENHNYSNTMNLLSSPEPVPEHMLVYYYIKVN